MYRVCAYTIGESHAAALELLAGADGLVDRNRPNASAMLRALITEEVSRRAVAAGKDSAWAELQEDIRAELLLERNEVIRQARKAD